MRRKRTRGDSNGVPHQAKRQKIATTNTTPESSEQEIKKPTYKQ